MREWLSRNNLPLCFWGLVIVILTVPFVIDRTYYRPKTEEQYRLFQLAIEERATKNQKIVQSIEGVTLQGCTDGSYMLEHVQITNSNTETVFVHHVGSVKCHCEGILAIVRIDPGQTIELNTRTFGGKLIIHTSAGAVGLLSLNCPK